MAIHPTKSSPSWRTMGSDCEGCQTPFGQSNKRCAFKVGEIRDALDIIQIEAILNSRPLTPLSSNPRDLGFLTPGYFLIGTLLTACSEESLVDIPVNRLSRWQHIQRLRQQFWHHEYLHLLQQRDKWRTPEFSLKVGQHYSN